MLKGERREQKKGKAEAKVQRKSNIKSLTVGIRARAARRQRIQTTRRNANG